MIIHTPHLMGNLTCVKQDFMGATKLLEDLCAQQFSSSTSSSPALRSAIARVYLQSGNISMAAKQFAIVAADPDADTALKGMNAALMTSAEGNWVAASEMLKTVIEEDAENYVVSPLHAIRSHQR